MGLERFLPLPKKPQYKVYIEPRLEEVARVITSFKRTHVIILFAGCEVEYVGRAKASLSYGERILLHKPDGTFLIHEDVKYTPVIWNPPGSVLTASVEEGVLVLRSHRPRPPEDVRVEITEVFFAAVAKLSRGEFRLVGTEEDMVREVEKNPSIIEDGLKVIGREVRTLVGKIDLLCVDKDGRYVVLEFKRGTAGPDAVYQLRRYVEFVSKEKNVPIERVRGVLVAPAITPSAYRLLRSYRLEYHKWKREVY